MRALVWLCSGCVFIFSWVFSIQSSATTFAPQPFPETVQQAPVIVHGKVGMHYTDWGKSPENSKQIYTYYELQVQETLKGSTNRSSITIRELGGEKDGVGFHVEGTSRYERGEDVVVLLRNQNSEGSFDVHGMMMGKYNVQVDSNGQEYLAGPGLYANADSPHWTLEALRQLIQSQQSKQIPSPTPKPTDHQNSPTIVENIPQPAAPQLHSHTDEETQISRGIPLFVWIGAGALGIGLVYALLKKKRREGQ